MYIGVQIRFITDSDYNRYEQRIIDIGYSYNVCYIVDDVWRINVFCVYNAGTHYSDVIMSTMASQITSLTIYSTVYPGGDQRKHHWLVASSGQAII